jgi:peptide/nickel transport system substrate-binding protein
MIRSRSEVPDGTPIVGVTRNEFLRRSAAAGLSASALALLLDACGSSGSSGGGGVTTTGAPSDTIPTIGTYGVMTPAAKAPIDSVTWGVGYEPTSLDWMLAYGPVENTIVSNVTECLMRLMPDFTYQPSLAESYKNPDPTTYVFKIREGVKFHDGSPLTAADVAYSLNRTVKSPTSLWATWTSSEKTIAATGPMEVTVKLNQPDVLFLQMMALPPGAVGKEAYVKAKGSAYGTPKGLPIGTGPYKATAWATGSSVTLAKNDDYWDKANAPKTGSISFAFQSSDSSLINSLVSGELDGAYYLPYESVGQLVNVSSGKLFQGPSMFNALMFFTTRPGPVQNPLVRRAWLYATDRTAIARSVFSNAAAPLPETFVPIPVWSYGQSAATKAYAALPGPSGDLKLAQALVKQAGSPKETIKVAVQSTQLDQQIGTVLQAAAESIGLSVEITALTPTQLINLLYDVKARSAYHAMLSTDYYSDVPDPVELFDELLGPPEPNALSYNYDNYSDKTVQSLILKARQTSDQTARAKMLLQAQTLMAPAVPVFPIVAPASLVFLGKRVTGVPASFCYNYYPWARDLGAA